jgi:hypothetical protein
MNKFLQITFLSAIITFSGCCYKRACVSPPNPVTILNLLFNYNQADSHSFPNGSNADFYIIRADSNYNSIDSAQLFMGQQGFNYVGSINEYNFTKLEGYNFIIVNRPIGFSDTIADLTYAKIFHTGVCDECFNENNYFDYETIENVKFKHKSLSITADSLLISRN